MFVIKKGKYYVKAAQGQKTPYTTDISRARLFATREEAEKNRCPENERVVEVRRVEVRRVAGYAEK